MCRYVLRPPLANDRLHVLPDDKVQLDFKRPWLDGTNSVVLAPLALIARLAAIVPPPKRHVTRYFGVLSSHSGLRETGGAHPRRASRAGGNRRSRDPGQRHCKAATQVKVHPVA